MPDERFSMKHLSQSNINKLFGLSSRKADKREASRQNAPDAVITFEGFPPDPIDSRLTVAGAIVDSFQKLERLAYVDLKDYFADEAPKELHPFPTMPGMNTDEEAQCIGLKAWSDARGEGWIAANPRNSTNNSFNARTWGSWRFAFLLAKLQRAVWCEGLESEVSAKMQSNAKAVEDRQDDEEPQKRKRGRPRKDVRVSERQLEEEKEEQLDESTRGESHKSGIVHEEAPALDEEDEEAEFDFPPDPQDARLTVEGAVCKENGKILTSAYKDEQLMSIFVNEPSHEVHPDPERPGLRQLEIDDPGISELQRGLRPWRDNKGRGWIAARWNSGKTESAWISAVTLRSWRLSLLVARLQIKVWESEAAPALDRNVAVPHAPVPKAASTPETRTSPPHFPQRRRHLHPTTARSEASSRHQRRATSPEVAKSEASSRHQKRAPSPEVQDTNIPVLDDDQEERELFARNLGYRRKRKKSERETPTEPEQNEGNPRVGIDHPGGKRIRPDATMDPRSKFLQERRLRRKGTIRGSSFDSIGEAIDEAKANRQIEEDLRILTKASVAELRAAEPDDAFSPSELSNVSLGSLATPLPALTLGDMMDSQAEDLSSSSVSSQVFVDEDVLTGASSSGVTSSPSSSNEIFRIQLKWDRSVPYPKVDFREDAVCSGPQTETDVEAAIKELLQVSQIY